MVLVSLAVVHNRACRGTFQAIEPTRVCVSQCVALELYLRLGVKKFQTTP